MNRLFLQIWYKKSHAMRKLHSFDQIVGHDDIKMILNNAIHSKNPVHILLPGPAGTAKTKFLLEFSLIFKKSLFVVGSNTTKGGLVNRLFEVMPKILLVDELEKMLTK